MAQAPRVPRAGGDIRSPGVTQGCLRVPTAAAWPSHPIPAPAPFPAPVSTILAPAQSALPMGTPVTCVTACGDSPSLDGAGRGLRSPSVAGATPGGDTEGSMVSLGFCHTPWMGMDRGGSWGWHCQFVPCFSALCHLCEQTQGCVCPSWGPALLCCPGLCRVWGGQG